MLTANVADSACAESSSSSSKMEIDEQDNTTIVKGDTSTNTAEVNPEDTTAQMERIAIENIRMEREAAEAAEAALERMKQKVASWYLNTSAEHAEDTFKGMVLRRVVKESHEREIKDVRFNLSAENCENLIATIGGTQLNVYDTESYINQYEEDAQQDGTHVDILLQHIGDEHQTLECVCWLASECGDAVVAVGGAENTVRVFSNGRLAEVAEFHGHGGSVTLLEAVPCRPGVFVSASKSDWSVRAWQLTVEPPKFNGCPPTDTKHCLSLCKLQSAPTSLCASGDGLHVLVGCRDGSVVQLPIPTRDGISEVADISIRAPEPLFSKHNTAVDSLHYLDAHTILSKSTDNHTMKWDLGTGVVLSTVIKSRGFGAGWCRFDVSHDKRYMCVGTDGGAVLVFDLVSKAIVVSLKHPRVKEMRVMACAFSKDMSRIVCATEKSYVFRFDYIDPRIHKQWNNRSVTDASDDSDTGVQPERADSDDDDDMGSS